MIEVLCEGGCILTEVSVTYQLMCHLMKDCVIPEDGFIELAFSDGTRASIRKKSIIGFYETGENAQT